MISSYILCMPRDMCLDCWCFSKGERIIDEYIIDFIDYISLGCGSVSYLKGNLYVNSFALNKYRRLSVRK